jgi:hypothetical protein
MAIVYPVLVPDFLRQVNFGTYNPLVNEYTTGDEFRLDTQKFAVGTGITFEYVNRKGDELSSLIDFLREIRGGKEFILPYQVWKHKNGFYLGLLDLLRNSKFIISDDITFQTVRKNIYNFSVNLVSVLSNVNNKFSDYSETLKVVVRYPMVSGGTDLGYYGEPVVDTYENDNPLAYFTWGNVEEGLIKKFKVNKVNPDGSVTPQFEYYNEDSIFYPLSEVRVI